MDDEAGRMDNIISGQKKCISFTRAAIVEATENFSSSCLLGEGGQAEVFKGKISGTQYAIKRFKNKEVKLLAREFDILFRLRHPHIVLLVGVCEEENCLISEFMSGGTLKDRLDDLSAPLTWKERFQITDMLVQAVWFMHTDKVLHMDLKPDNVLLGPSLVVKVADMGISMSIQSSTKFKAGKTVSDVCFTKGYVDPRFLITGKADSRNDIYSLGLIILQLSTNIADIGSVHEILGFQIENSDEIRQHLFPIDSTMPSDSCLRFTEVGIRCCNQNPDERPSLEEIHACVLDFEEFPNSILVPLPRNEPEVAGTSAAVPVAIPALASTSASSSSQTLAKGNLEDYVPVEGITPERRDTFIGELKKSWRPWTELGMKYLRGTDPCQQDYSQSYRVLKIAKDRNEPNPTKYITELIKLVCSVLESNPGSGEMLNLAKEAANDGSAMAALALGHLYKKEELFFESLHWFTVAAQRDSGLRGLTRNEMDDIFVMLSKSLESSPSESYLGMLETYSEQHPFSAAARLGYLYGIGAVGVGRVDEKKAFQLYEKAAAGGTDAAQWNVGCYYHDGRGGVEKNKQLAMEWFDKAAENGYERAKQMLKEMRAKYSSPSQPFKWRIDNFSSKFSAGSILQSDTFSAHGSTWRMVLYPKGYQNNSSHISVYLTPVSLESWPVVVHYSFVLVNFNNPLKHRVIENYDEFTSNNESWGSQRHTPREDIRHPKNGYVKGDAIEIEAILEVKV